MGEKGGKEKEKKKNTSFQSSNTKNKLLRIIFKALRISVLTYFLQFIIFRLVISDIAVFYSMRSFMQK